MQQFKGKYWIWDGVPKAPFRPGCLLTVDAECVKLTRKFPPSLFLRTALLWLLLIGVLSGLVGMLLFITGILSGHLEMPDWRRMIVLWTSVLLGLLALFSLNAIKNWWVVRRFSLSRVANVELRGSEVQFTVLASPVAPERHRGESSPSVSGGRESDEEISFQMAFRAASPEQAAGLRDLLSRTSASNLAQKFKGTYGIWDVASKVPFSGDSAGWYLLTVDAESVKLTRKFPPMLLLACAAIMLLVIYDLLWAPDERQTVLFIFGLAALASLIGIKKWREGRRFSLSRVADVELRGSEVKFTVLGSPVEPATKREARRFTMRLLARLFSSGSTARSPGDPSPSVAEGGRESDAETSFQMAFRATSPEQAAALRDLLPKTRDLQSNLKPWECKVLTTR
jgi:hypothetical protein